MFVRGKLGSLHLIAIELDYQVIDLGFAQSRSASYENGFAETGPATKAMLIRELRDMPRRFVFALAAICLCLSAPSHAVTLDITPNSAIGNVGSPFTVELGILGLGGGTALGAFDINFNFDSALVNFQSASFGDPHLGDQLDLSRLGINSPLATPGVGTVNLIETSFDDSALLIQSQAVKFTLASLTFAGMSAGAAPFSITINSLSDAFGGPITATATLGSATIAAVPEPSTWTLSVAGLAIVALVARLRDPRLTPLRRRVGPIGGFSCVKSRA